jgi:N-methylhydantoinase A
MQEGLAREEILRHRSVDLRYLGQSYALNVPWQDRDVSAAAFHQLHEKRYGHRLAQSVELVTVRVKLTGANPHIDLQPLPQNDSTAKERADIQKVNLVGIDGDVSVYRRDLLKPGELIQGPALVAETVSTTYLAPEWACSVDGYGNLLLNRAL